MWLMHAWPEVLDLLRAHVLLSVPAIVISVLVAVPVGLFAARHPRVGNTVVQVTSLAYTIPALPMLVIVPFIVAVPLRSQINVIIALCVYGIALIVRTATDAFRSVPEEVRTAAVAQGMSPSQIAWKVDMPLAIPVLISGLRVLCVSTVGLVTIGALIGVSSLGSLFTDGFQRNITAEVVVGIVAVVLLAVLFDVACLILQRLCTPWTRLGKAR
ncbi:ABC transporter permease [Corynebacterium diphtheriae]|uniref:ABC transporter permease n=1 Tax=Corynebacterium diphtheriae bv. gravis TaxID=1720349 RepID=A0AAX0J1N7_CORDP|nr:ABC transporter permease [Corynebacterium diphtheriae]OWN10324.1 ABC transporter permease [Corynebacterium belfantii]AEX40790.1 choline transport system permease protein [Corynebacterium diphtheriae 31A]AEX66260.1 choline transport system permease protein [Corynebacterium diphtheriae C7 (beta)]AEX71063.1 choline transport system permease protein [Corynebacterium diphtheriae CDCE 8392]MBG9264326.1 ABC transporter permease [Corynebacterium diphtheriae bv. gravis]